MKAMVNQWKPQTLRSYGFNNSIHHSMIESSGVCSMNNPLIHWIKLDDMFGNPFHLDCVLILFDCVPNGFYSLMFDSKITTMNLLPFIPLRSWPDLPIGFITFHRSHGVGGESCGLSQFIVHRLNVVNFWTFLASSLGSHPKCECLWMDEVHWFHMNSDLNSRYVDPLHDPLPSF